MDKQKEIERMTKIVKDNANRNLLDGYVCTVDDDITALVYAGYGDVKQAIIEYADKLASHIAGLWINYKATAEKLINAGYGNIERAIKSFGKRIKNMILQSDVPGSKALCSGVDRIIQEELEIRKNESVVS